MSKSTLTLDDSPWKLGEWFQKKIPFFEFMRFYKYYLKHDQETPYAERNYYSVYFRADNNSREYRRETYSLLEYFGDLGGLIDMLLILFTFFVNQLIERQFNAAILGKTFQVQDYNRDQSEFYSSSKKYQRMKRRGTTFSNNIQADRNEVELTTESASQEHDSAEDRAVKSEEQGQHVQNIEGDEEEEKSSSGYSETSDNMNAMAQNFERNLA